MGAFLKNWAAIALLLAGLAPADAGAGVLPLRLEALPPVSLSTPHTVGLEGLAQVREDSLLLLAAPPATEGPTVLMLLAGLGGLVFLGRRRELA